MTVIFHALLMFCALSALVFGATAARRWLHVAALALGFGVSAALLLRAGLAGVPDATLVALTGAGAALLLLLQPRHAIVATACGGGLGAVAGALLAAQGMPSGAAFAATAAATGVSVCLARWRPAFAPDAIRDESLLVICGLGVALAVLPTALDGWQAALNLNAHGERPAEAMIPSWTLMLLAISMALGGAYSLWSRR